MWSFKSFGGRALIAILEKRSCFSLSSTSAFINILEVVVDVGVVVGGGVARGLALCFRCR